MKKRISSLKIPPLFCLLDVRILDKIGGTEYTVTESCKGTETLDKKFKYIMANNKETDKFNITEESKDE